MVKSRADIPRSGGRAQTVIRERRYAKVDAKTVPIRLSDGIRAVMEERGIREEDVREVLDYAESTGKKLYVEGEEHYLAKKRIGNFTCNVEYAVADGEVELLDLYSYMVQLSGRED